MPARRDAADVGDGLHSLQALAIAMRCPVTAADGGHIFGLERLEIPGVVPIKWPRKRGMRFIVASVASSRSIVWAPIQPKSRAQTTDSRYNPMLVGEVRWATSDDGSSWKLSGGNILSFSAVSKRFEEPPGPTRDLTQGQ